MCVCRGRGGLKLSFSAQGCQALHMSTWPSSRVPWFLQAFQNKQYLVKQTKSHYTWGAAGVGPLS